MTITTIGLDLAKNVFQVHGVNEHGKVVLRKQIPRSQLSEFFANLPACRIGMEACSSAHHWARKLSTLGHETLLMAPQFVKPYVKGSKTDAADAEAICEAVSRPNMRFVPVKNPEQQALLAVHRSRASFVKARTAQANQMRGLPAEFGIIIPVGLATLRQRLAGIVEDVANNLPTMMRELFARLAEHLKMLDQQVAELEKQIQLWHRQSETRARGIEVGLDGLDPVSHAKPRAGLMFQVGVSQAKQSRCSG